MAAHGAKLSMPGPMGRCICGLPAGTEAVLGGFQGTEVVSAGVVELDEAEQFRQVNLPILRVVVAAVRFAVVTRAGRGQESVLARFG